MGAAAQLGWDFALPDWRDRLKSGADLVPDLPLDPVAVAKAIGIYNKLRLPDVAGKPTLREAGGDWYRNCVIAPIFGSIDETGMRHVRNVLVLVPKKNSKTTNAGATMVTAVLVDKDPQQAYRLYGPTQDIADRGFAQARGMIEADEVLTARFHIAAHMKTITDRTNDTTLRVQTFDESVATGEIIKGALVDELHILGKKSYAQRVLGQLEGGMISRPGAFILKITTQSDEPPAGVFAADLMLARSIRDGKVTGLAANMLPVLYEFDEEFQRSGKWKDSRYWPMVTPNLGKSIRLELLEADHAKAAVKGDAELKRWASQHLNIEIGLGLHDQRWRGADYWEAAAFAPIRDLDELLARVEVAVVTIDGGGLDDLTGLCVAGRDRKTKVWLYWFHAWAHRKVLDLRKEIAPRLLDFEAEGTLSFWGNPDVVASVATRLTDDGEEEEYVERPKRDVFDADVLDIVDICIRVRDASLLPELGGIGVDAASIGALLEGLEDAGFTLVSEGKGDVTAVSQSTVNMFSAISTLERRLEAGTAAHGGSALMNWCVGNAKAELRGNSVAITKQQAGKAKIDPLIAGFMATKLLERNPVRADTVSDWIKSLRA